MSSKVKKEKIQLSDHFDFMKLLRFVIPSIIMMIFTSVYGVVDGYFVSNYVGKIPFAAVNLIMPVIIILGAIGFMLGTGGSALVSKTLGEEEHKKANEIFTMLVLFGIISGIIFALIGCIFIKPIAVLLGAESEMIDLCATYARIILSVLPAYMLQNMFQSFFVTAEKPKLGLLVTVIAGVTNMVLDALFMMVFGWGIAGAAIATAISQLAGGIIPLIYFMRKNSSTLKFVKPVFDMKALANTLLNGSSEFVTNISMSVVAVLYNLQLIKYAGNDGVAAYGVIMYVSYIFIAIFLGYSIGVAPVIGYNYGAGRDNELKNVFKKSMIFIIAAGVVLTGGAYLLANPLSDIFVGYDKELLKLTTHALKVYGFSFFFCGIGVFGSALFTALNNGIVSAAISFLRTLVFQVMTILIMPAIWGIEGVWYAIIVSETLAALTSVIFILCYRKKYKY